VKVLRATRHFDIPRSRGMGPLYVQDRKSEAVRGLLRRALAVIADPARVV
jgi:hypothetical protein